MTGLTPLVYYNALEVLLAQRGRLFAARFDPFATSHFTTSLHLGCFVR
jgi:hypothetical protein